MLVQAYVDMFSCSIFKEKDTLTKKNDILIGFQPNAGSKTWLAICLFFSKNQVRYVYIQDLLLLLKNTFDRKRVSANPSTNPITLKHNNVFELTK